MIVGEVVRWTPVDHTSDKPMFMSKNGRYVCYNDWKKEHEQVELLKKELIRAYFMIEGVIDVDITNGRATLVFSLDKRKGEV